MAEHWDYIVVGAGSSGSALAARLSENTDVSVLVLESGPSYLGPGNLPTELRMVADMRASVPGNPHNWSFTGSLTPRINYPVARGRVTGGSGTVNGGLFMRGTPVDFAEWEARGLDEWAYEKVLPAFKRSEHDLDFDNEFHGQDGPIPVRRTTEAEYAPVSHAFANDAQHVGFPVDLDYNAPGSIGVGSIPLNVVDGVRYNAANAYLDDAISRPNLEVRDHATVLRLLFDGLTVTGVEAETSEGVRRFEADEIILSAGAIKSPHLLLVSGIGPAKELTDAGVAVRLDLPGVGKGFTDHPDVYVTYKLDEDALAKTPQTMFQLGLNLTSPVGGAENDLLMLATVSSMSGAMFKRATKGEGSEASAWRHPFRSLNALRGSSMSRIVRQLRQGADLGFMTTLISQESRGDLTIASADPGVGPRLKFNYLSEPADRARLRHGVRTGVEILEGPAYRKLGAKRTMPGPTDLVNDRALDSWIDRSIATAYHSAATCSMGAESDAASVTDQHGRVHGVRGLRIADLSILPKVVRRGTNATAVMIGERIAELIAAERA